MPEYRFYLIGDGGHVAGPPVQYVGPNDTTAIKEAKRLVDGHDVEIWQSERVVAYLTADDGKAE